MIYLYAIAERREQFPERAGLDGAGVEQIEVGGLAAICSRHEDLVVAPDAAALWHHERVVERVMEQAPALPVRFGTTFADLDAMRRAVFTQLGDVGGALERVRGCVELAVRVQPPHEAPVRPPDGAAYLRSKLDAERASRRLLTEVLAPLGDLAVASRVLERTGPASVGVSYLVRREEVTRFVAEVRRRERAHPRLGISCTGPWAPYSFVEEAA